MGRPNRRQREQARRQRLAEAERDATMLPVSGPIADLVAAIGAELIRCFAAGRAPHEAVPFLRPLDEEACRLNGSRCGMRATAWKAADLDPRRAEMRRDMIDKAWDGIAAGGSAWCA